MFSAIQATPTRPFMTEAEAERYSPPIVLAKDPYAIDLDSDPIEAALIGAPRNKNAQYLVDANPSAPDGAFKSIPQAISHAIHHAEEHGSTERIVIAIAPGTYEDLVYVPELKISGANVPITLIGLGEKPQETSISVNIDQGIIASDYERRFAPAFEGLHASIVDMFNKVTERGSFDIGTTNACVMRIRNHGFEAINLTVENSYNEDRITSDNTSIDPSQLQRNEKGQLADGQHQAVAVLIDCADRVHFDTVRLLGDQDTLYCKTDEPQQTVKSYFKNCYIEGDVDFIFGNSTMLFDSCEICSKGARRTPAYVAAPSTNLHVPYGIVFWDCDFTHDGSDNALAGNFFLARQWFERVRCTPYGTSTIDGYQCSLGEISHFDNPTGTIAQKTLEAVGKVAILNSRIGPHINPVAPWTDWKGGTFEKDGTYHPAEWNDRYRPVQYGLEDFLRLLGPWLEEQGLDYNQSQNTLPFIAEFNNENAS